MGTVEFATRQVDGIEAATEQGILCTECGNWTHSCWMNAALDTMVKEIAKTQAVDGDTASVRALAGMYNQAFENFQLVMERRAARQDAGQQNAGQGKGQKNEPSEPVEKQGWYAGR
jgi:L-lactate utilization protein LutB